MFLWVLILCKVMYTYIVYRYRTLTPQKLLIFVVFRMFNRNKTTI